MYVVPLSYKWSEQDLKYRLDKCNGLYVHGDSIENIFSEEFNIAIKYLLSYIDLRNLADKVHFPAFFMGSSIQSLVKVETVTLNSRLGILTRMTNMVNRCYGINWWLTTNTTTFLEGYSYAAAIFIM